jgi:simple sugar transport system ATP-binding protein
VLQRAKAVIFDEPTASPTPEDSKDVFDLRRDFEKARGSIVFISYSRVQELPVAETHHGAA